MTECVILFRKHPKRDGSYGDVGILVAGDDGPHVFKDRDAAVNYVLGNRYLNSVPAYQIVELDEL